MKKEKSHSNTERADTLHSEASNKISRALDGARAVSVRNEKEVIIGPPSEYHSFSTMNELDAVLRECPLFVEYGSILIRDTISQYLGLAQWFNPLSKSTLQISNNDDTGYSASLLSHFLVIL